MKGKTKPAKRDKHPPLHKCAGCDTFKSSTYALKLHREYCVPRAPLPEYMK